MVCHTEFLYKCLLLQLHNLSFKIPQVTVLPNVSPLNNMSHQEVSLMFNLIWKPMSHTVCFLLHFWYQCFYYSALVIYAAAINCPQISLAYNHSLRSHWPSCGLQWAPWVFFILRSGRKEKPFPGTHYSCKRRKGATEPGDSFYGFCSNVAYNIAVHNFVWQMWVRWPKLISRVGMCKPLK